MTAGEILILIDRVAVLKKLRISILLKELNFDDNDVKIMKTGEEWRKLEHHLRSSGKSDAFCQVAPGLKWRGQRQRQLQKKQRQRQ